MSFRFTVLASGSAGNAALIEANGFGLLLDAGLGPRQLAARLASVGASWRRVQAVLLTHTHSDHWKERTFAHLRRLRVPVYCHAEHHPSLLTYSRAFAALQADRLVRGYEANEDLLLAPAFRCRPLPLRHDGGATFGFRLDSTPRRLADSPAGLRLTTHHSPLTTHQSWSLAYAADLGSWTPELAQQLADVDVLALEFNHDVELENASGRSPDLIARVLGDEGHLSNDQAAALLREVVRRSAPGRLRHVVLLHLSRDCNRPALALEAARQALAEANRERQRPEYRVEIHAACQDQAGPILPLAASSPFLPFG